MRIRGLAVMLTAGAPTAALAQESMDWLTPAIEAQRLGDLLRTNMKASGPARARRPAAPRQTAVSRPTPTAAQPANASFAFQSTPGSRRASLDGLVQRIAISNPAAAAQAGSALRQHDVSAFYTQITAPFGLKRMAPPMR